MSLIMSFDTVFNFDEVQFSIFIFVAHAFSVIAKIPLPDHEDFPQCFLLRVLYC